MKSLNDSRFAGLRIVPTQAIELRLYPVRQLPAKAPFPREIRRRINNTLRRRYGERYAAQTIGGTMYVHPSVFAELKAKFSAIQDEGKENEKNDPDRPAAERGSNLAGIGE